MSENAQNRGLTSDISGIKEQPKPFMESGTAAFLGGSLWGLARGAFYGALLSLFIVACFASGGGLAAGVGTLIAGSTIATGAVIFGIRDGQKALEKTLYDSAPPPPEEEKPKEKTIIQSLLSKSREPENEPRTKFTDAVNIRKANSQTIQR